MGPVPIQDFHRKLILMNTDKTVNNGVVVWKVYYINTLKQEFSTSKTHEYNLLDKRYVVDKHQCHMAA